MSVRSYNDPEMIAHHEAAHVVLAWHRGNDCVLSVELGDHPRCVMEGGARLDPPQTMAGHLADHYYLGDGQTPAWAVDYAELVAVASEARAVEGPGSDPELLVDWLGAKPAASRRGHLLDCWLEADALVREHWAEIERVASALLSIGHLDATALAAILGPQTPRRRRALARSTGGRQ